MPKPLYAAFFALLLLIGLSACSKPETALPANSTVLILGDSLTQGVGASSAQTNYPALLKQQTQWNIINGGVSGNTELMSNLVYGIQAAFSVDCFSTCSPSLKATLLTTKVSKLNP